MKFYNYFKISILILFLLFFVLVLLLFIKKSYFINNDISNLIYTDKFNIKEDGWNGTENWYNIKYSFKSKDKEISSFRTISFAKPNNFNGKYLINFDFVTGENNNQIPTKLNKNKLPSYFIYQDSDINLKGGIMHNVDNLKDYTIKGPQMIFRYLLNNGYGILNLTQSSEDTLAYHSSICNSGICNSSNNLRSDLSNLKIGQRHHILADMYKEKFENINNTFTQACSNPNTCYNNQSYCSQFSNCNSNTDLYWQTQFGLSSDCKYMINALTFIKNLHKDLKYDEVSLFGWSVGASMVSRCINEFSGKSEFSELYKKLNFNWPKNINFAIMGAGGSLHCYEMNKYDNKYISTCSYEEKDKLRPHNANTKNGCCPYFDNSNSNIKKKYSPVLEPVYVDGKVPWKNHPPVFLFQSANDSYADPFATRSYINTLNYYLNKHNINIRNEISLNESSSIHGMSSDKQINDCIKFIKNIENIN